MYYDTRNSQIHLWEQINNENLYTEIPWTPYVFTPCIEENADVKTIFGKYVEKRDFLTYYHYKKFLEKHNSPNVSENNVKNEIQFLAERYHGIPDGEMYIPNLLVYYIDIEVLAEEGFPKWKNPKDIITLISVRNGQNKNTIVFGFDPFSDREYTGNENNIRYIKCKNEEELLKRFFAYLHKFPCDVLSGFNISPGFDIPYVINRAKVLFGEELGEEFYNKMSPINKVNVWKQQNSDDLNIDIAGMTILDYMDLYKRYGKNLERYSLEYISQKELKVGKLKNLYSSLNELAKKDWNRYTEYNAIDCERVNDLEDKLGYIRMIQALSLLCKSPMKNYTSQTQLIEGLMLTYFRRNGLCAPHFKGGEQETFKAAYIKEPQIGLHKWIVDVDITSSYPSHIITLNMSTETFFGKIVRFEEEEIASYVKKRRFPKFKLIKEDNNSEWNLISFDGEKLDKFNMALKKGLFSIAPNGSVFVANKLGVIADVQKYVFFKRKEVKGERDEFGRKANKCTGIEQEKCKEKERERDTLQGAIKIMMNAFYGILSVPYSRYHNVYIAGAITSCARRTIRYGEIFSNHLLNNPSIELQEILNKIDVYKNNDFDKDRIVYIHTDSLFLNLNEFILDSIQNKNKWMELEDEKKIELIKGISKCIENYVNDRIFNEIQLADYNSQVHDFKIGFKQEIIAKTMLVVKKSKYAYWLVNKEGVPKDTIKVTGLDIIRSESAEAIRPRLKDVMEMIIKEKSDDEIANKIRVYKKELNSLNPEDLAANIGVNGIKKYLGSGIPKKGTPWHVKGVHGYRLLLKELELEDKYEDIKEGLKAKVIYVKKNPYNVETVSFYEWPEKFNELIQFDSETMIDKFFMKKVRFLLNPMNKEHIIDSDMNAVKVFFG